MCERKSGNEGVRARGSVGVVRKGRWAKGLTSRRILEARTLGRRGRWELREEAREEALDDIREDPMRDEPGPGGAARDAPRPPPPRSPRNAHGHARFFFAGFFFAGVWRNVVLR